MKKTVFDAISGHDVEMKLVGNNASMTANGNLITETIRTADLSMAKVALAKRDLNGFGSFFERGLS